MNFTIKGEGRQVREQTKSANLTGITDDRGDNRKRTFKPFRLRDSAFNAHERKVHDQAGCSVCGHMRAFVP